MFLKSIGYDWNPTCTMAMTLDFETTCWRHLSRMLFCFDFGKINSKMPKIDAENGKILWNWLRTRFPDAPDQQTEEKKLVERHMKGFKLRKKFVEGYENLLTFLHVQHQF